MTINRRDNQKKAIVTSVCAIILIAYSVYQYSANSILINKNESKLDKKNQVLLAAQEKSNSLKKNIISLEQKLAEQQKKGIDKNQVKRDIDSLLGTIEIVSLKTKSVDFHDNYNNLLKVVLEFPYSADTIKNRANAFYAQKVLNIPSIKAFLKLYGDYKVNNNQITFLYYKEVSDKNKGIL